MNHTDHVGLLRPAEIDNGGIWADLGAGRGAFTLALAELIGPQGIIYSVDKDGGALQEQERAMRNQFPNNTVHYRQADFTRSLELPPLDGIIMANSLHFQRDKEAVLAKVCGYLKPGGRLLLVEYNIDRGNMWVPYPLSYPTWEKLASRNGFTETRLLATHPSRYWDEMYSAASHT